MIEFEEKYVLAPRDAMSLWEATRTGDGDKLPPGRFSHSVIEQLYPQGENIRLRWTKLLKMPPSPMEILTRWDAGVFKGIGAPPVYVSTSKIPLIEKGWPNGKTIEIEGHIRPETYELVAKELTCTRIRKLRIGYHLPESRTHWSVDLFVALDGNGFDFAMIEGETNSDEEPEELPFPGFDYVKVPQKYYRDYSNVNLANESARGALLEAFERSISHG